MVKVYKCHNFKSQSVVPVVVEPVAVFSSKDKVFVATQQCVVEVFTLEEQESSGSKFIKSNTFSTEAPIRQLLYNEAGGYIATIECKVSRKQKFYSVKVYLNWSVCTEETPTVTHVRLAGSNQSVKPPDSQSPWLEVIHIPCKHKVSSITTCTKTGNLAVASRDVVYLYHLVEKTLPNLDKTFLDVVLFLQLHWSFIVDQVFVCEDIVSVLSEKEVQVIRVIYSDTSYGKSLVDEADTRVSRSISTDSFRIANRKTSSSIINPSFVLDRDVAANVNQFSNVGTRSSSTPSPALSNSSVTRSLSDTFSCILDDENFVQWKFEESDSSRNEPSHGPGSRRQLKDTRTVYLKGMQDLMCRDLILADPPKVEDLRGGGHMTLGDVKVTTVLYKRWNTQDVDGGWRHVQIVPTYLSKNEKFSMAERVGSIPVHSSSFSELVGVCVIVSGDIIGYLYSLWPQNCLLTEYRYTMAAIQVWAEGNLLYVLTNNGLEIYTCRAAASAAYSLEDYSSPVKAFPSIREDVCLCGMHQFIGPRQMTVSQNHVILLAMVEAGGRQDDRVWSLYALEKISNEELYKEMIAFGSRYQRKNPDTYLSLLEEGHMILRWSMLTGPHGDPSSDLLQESAALLGDVYAMPGNSQWHLCLPYYLMSGLSLADIVRQALQYKQHTKRSTAYCYGQGFLNYLNYVLFQDEEAFKLKEEEGDMILDVCAETMPEKLSRIVLFSRLHTYSVDKALRLLKDTIQQKSKVDEAKSGVDMLALSILHLRSCDPELARLALAAVNQVELMQFCVSHHQLLHEDFQQLSPLSQLMRRHCPEVLIQCLIDLHDVGTIPLDLAIKLLQGPSGYEEIHQNAHLKDYLELLINEDQRKYVFEDAVALLSEIYVRCLVAWRPPSASLQITPTIGHLPKGDGHFGERYAWLDYIPPLQGPQAIRQPCQYTITANPTSTRRSAPCTQVKVTSSPTAIRRSTPAMQTKVKTPCSCFWCREVLLKLQSILCSAFTTLTLVDKVVALLDKDTQGYDSLWMLCMLRKDTVKATEVVMEKYPDILTDYAITVMQKDISKWKGFLKTLMENLRKQAERPDDHEPKFLEGLKGVCSWLASDLEPANFLELLPGDGNFMFFLPFIATCYKKQQSRQILSAIVTKGELLKGDHLKQSAV